MTKKPSAKGGNGQGSDAAPVPAPAAPTPPDDGRDPTTGRFVPGYAGGPGNPYARRIASLKRALLSGVTDDDFVEIGKKLVQMARAGDLDAVEMLLKYSVGAPPKTTVHPDLVESDEIHTVIVLRRARKDEQFSRIFEE